MTSPIERFLAGQKVSTSAQMVEDSRALLMDEIDDILATSILDLTRADVVDLVAALHTVADSFAEAHIEHEEGGAFEPVTSRAVQIISLVIAAYAEALETEDARETVGGETKEEPDSE